MIEARTANTVLPKAELIFRPAQYGLLDWIFVQGLTFVLRLNLTMTVQSLKKNFIPCLHHDKQGIFGFTCLSRTVF